MNKDLKDLLRACEALTYRINEGLGVEEFDISPIAEELSHMENLMLKIQLKHSIYNKGDKKYENDI